MHTDPIDLRKGFEGLSYMTESLFPKMLLTGAYFVFLNKTRNRMKVLCWDVDGLAIWHKRLEKGTFSKKSSEKQMDRRQFFMLLDLIIFEWCGTSTLESVRSIYLEAYIHEDLYRTFLDVPDAEEAKIKLNTGWDFRKAAYQAKLESNPPNAYFAIAKKDSKIIGFVIFDTDELGTSKDSSSSGNSSFPPEEVFISPIMILPEAQGTGLGKELVFSILKRFPNLKKISLATIKTMPASEFYKHLGFQEIKNKEKQDQIDDPKLRETVTFFEWINPDA